MPADLNDLSARAAAISALEPFAYFRERTGPNPLRDLDWAIQKNRPVAPVFQWTGVYREAEVESLRALIADYAAAYAAQEGQIAALRDALIKFGEHADHCTITKYAEGWGTKMPRCSCGLSEALEGGNV